MKSIVVPFVDLRKQYSLHREKFEAAIRGTCEAASFILGPEVGLFEKRFASYLGASEAVGVASGTDALRLAGRAFDIGPGDEVLVPANTFVATAMAFQLLGAVPVPVEVHPDSFLMDLADAPKRLTARARAIVPVHLYGQCMEMEPVLEFARENGLVVIEDACQSHGASWNGKRAGTFGSMGCFSFYPGKNLGAFGDGGLVATNDADLAHRLRLLRNYGSSKKYYHESVGENSRLDSIQAAVLNVKLDLLDGWNAARFRAACLYTDKLKDVSGLKVPVFDLKNASRHVFHLYVIQCEKREQLLAFLEERGIQAGIHYPVPIHLHKACAAYGYKKGDYPVAELLSETILSLPMFPEITEEQIDVVVNAIKEFYEN